MGLWDAEPLHLVFRDDDHRKFVKNAKNAKNASIFMGIACLRTWIREGRENQNATLLSMFPLVNSHLVTHICLMCLDGTQKLGSVQNQNAAYLLLKQACEDEGDRYNEQMPLPSGVMILRPTDCIFDQDLLPLICL